MTPAVPISTARPEHALILAAAAPATDAAGRARLALLLQGPIDWTHVVETTDRHAVTALVLRRLADAATQLLPPELVEASEVYIARQRDTNQRLVAELVRIVGALSQQGIAVMPFKGPVLAELAYGDVALRQFRDLDFLVHEPDVDRALAVVEALGYIVASPLSPVQEGAFRRYAGQYIFWRADGDAPIEPHWAFAPRSLAVDLDYAGLWQRAVPVRLAGIELRCLAPADLIAVLCIHGSKEEWTRLQWICDIAQTLQSFPDIDWAVVLDRARRHGHLRMVLIGLALARSFLGSQIPPAIGGVLASDPTAARLAAEVAATLLEPGRTARDIYALSPFRWNMRERWRDRALYAWRTIVTPRRIHFEAVRLPDPLFAGYYPIKLLHDYVLLPLWRTGAGLRRVFGKPADRTPRADPANREPV